MLCGTIMQQYNLLYLILTILTLIFQSGCFVTGRGFVADVFIIFIILYF